MAKNEKPQTVQQEAGLPNDWQVLDTEPIVPGVSNYVRPVAAPPPIQAAPPQLGNYFSGPMPSDIQHDGQFVKTGYQSGSAVRTPLMPTPLVANPQNTAGIESIIRQFVTVVVPSTAPTTTSGLTYRGLWNNFTNYNIGDVVLSSTFLYVALVSSTNVTPAGNPATWEQLAGQGSVTSVALSVPASIMSVAGSPITTAGTLTVSLATQVANRFWAGPTGGADAIPTFRALVTADLPAGTGTVTSVALALPVSVFSISGSPVTTTGTLTGSFITQSANTVFAGPASGGAATPTFRQIATSELAEFTALNLTAQTADVSATTLKAVTLAGLYRISIYIVVSQAATVSSMMPDTQIIYDDQDSGATITINATAGDAGNTLSTFAQITLVVNAASASNIQYAIGQIDPYASSGATAMEFAYRVRVEYLG